METNQEGYVEEIGILMDKNQQFVKSIYPSAYYASNPFSLIYPHLIYNGESVVFIAWSLYNEGDAWYNASQTIKQLMVNILES